MTVSRWFRLLGGCVFVLPFLVACSHVSAQAADAEEYPFVAQKAGNRFDNYICLGIAGGIECLEEGTEVAGEESSTELAARVWNELTQSNDEDVDFVYFNSLRLRDGTKVRTCSRVAIEEVGMLIQAKYSHLIDTRLWQEQVQNPDPNTPDGRVLLEKRQKYLDLLNKKQENMITSEDQLKDLFNEGDEDGLVALTGRGWRYFKDGPPQRVIEKSKLKVDPKTGKYPISVPSYHAFLLIYEKEANQFYVYDSDDPDGKWPVGVEGTADQFMIHWQIDDHMGNGPSYQVYHDVRPLDECLDDVLKIVEGGHKNGQ